MSTGGGAEQASEHRARDALGFGGLAVYLPKGGYGLQHASMLRGVEVRGSEHFCLRILRKLECARTLGVPRALGISRVGRIADMKRGPARGRHKNTGGGALAVGQSKSVNARR